MDGCQETGQTQFCANCGVVIIGFEDDEVCECQTNNVVVNRFLSTAGEQCEHGRWLQVPARFINRDEP